MADSVKKVLSFFLVAFSLPVLQKGVQYSRKSIIDIGRAIFVYNTHLN